MAYNRSGHLLASNKRAYRTGNLARFVNPIVTEPSPRYQAELAEGHLALVNARTMFPSRVFDTGERDRILISGINNAKTGSRVTKGPWAGFPIFTFALEERATCPTSCHLWAACYGNALPMAVRFKFNGGFLMSLEEELVSMGDRYPGGFVVRAHVLGDFVSIDYVRHWRLWMEMVPALHVWGYTAHAPGTEIADAVYAMNHVFAGRWAFRNSVAPETAVDEWQASTTWEKPERVNDKHYRAIGGTVCPAETGGTATCGTCALCFSPAAAKTRIVFLGHGKRHRGARQEEVRPAPAKPSFYAPVAKHDASLDDLVAQAVARGAVTRLPARKAR